MRKKEMNRFEKSGPMRPCGFGGLLGCLVILTTCSPALACQSETQSKNKKAGTVEWRQDDLNQIQVGKAGLIQTFRIQRSAEPRSTVRSGIRIQDGNVDVVRDREIQIEAIDRLNIPGLNALEIFSKQLPHRYGVHGGQIIVELKKVNQDTEDHAVGVFAPNSWIEANNGRVELLANQFEFAPQPEFRYWIGVRCRETKTQASSKSAPEVELVVDHVVSDGAADRAGVQAKDRLVSWNEKQLDSVEALVHTIHVNQVKPANLKVVRAGQVMDIKITPDKKKLEKSHVQTLIVPAAQLKVAKKKIEELKKLVEKTDPKKNQQLRVLVVGPGVNFGNEEIELRINPEIHAKKAHLKELLNRVAEKKFGVIVKDNSVTLKKSPEAQNLLDDLDFEPHEIWETMQFGVNGKSISFQQLAPRIIHRATGDIVVTTDKVVKEKLHMMANELKTGQIVFPNPLSAMKRELQEEINQLKQENERIREVNADLQKVISDLKDRLGDLKNK